MGVNFFSWDTPDIDSTSSFLCSRKTKRWSIAHLLIIKPRTWGFHMTSFYIFVKVNDSRSFTGGRLPPPIDTGCLMTGSLWFMKSSPTKLGRYFVIPFFTPRKVPTISTISTTSDRGAGANRYCHRLWSVHRHPNCAPFEGLNGWMVPGPGFGWLGSIGFP